MDFTDESKAVSYEAFCPLTQNSYAAAALTADGAYTADALRTVRDTANADELAALVAALLLTRRAHERTQNPHESVSAHRNGGAGQNHGADHATHSTPYDEHHRPSWPRGGYTPLGSWTARP